jgi:hypothetical protein
VATNARTISASPEAVFSVLSDGWLYPTWVVGAARARNVTADWPAAGAEIHHSFGIWPVMLNDKTVMLDWQAPTSARLRARGWPIGEAEVLIEVRPSPEGCVVRITEDAVEGPGLLIPRILRRILIFLRNRETLRRLAYLAEGGAGGPRA